MAEALGIQRMVIVQPSVYGTDNECSLDAAARFGLDRARVVAVVDDSFDEAALRAMHDRGTRGVRFNAVSGNGTPLDQLDTLARRIAPLGWHLQVYAEGHQLPDLAPRLAALPVPVVIDHMGGVRTADGVNGPGFQALLRLLDAPRTYVKLCGYRISSAGPPFADVAPFARALLDASPDGCLWGTDWPHPSLSDWMPEDGALFDLLGEWAPGAAERKRVLVDNPARLYGF
jgi:predicted TIM-barrel fold metal-dependent hydrolase